MPFNIEWKSYHSDGRPRTRPPPSTIHGWLVKWRGTFGGDESLRSRGMREMREAHARRVQEHNSGGNLKKSDSASNGKSARPAARSTSTRTPPVRSTSTRTPPVRSTSTRTPGGAGAGGSASPLARPTVQRRATVTGASARPAPSRRPTGASSRPPVSRQATGQSARPSTRPTTRDGPRTQQRSQSTRR